MNDWKYLYSISFTVYYIVLVLLSQPNDNTTQQNLNTVVGLDMKMTLHTTPPPPPHHTNSTAASMSLRTTFIDDS